MKYQVLDSIFNQYKALRKFERLELDWNFRILDASEQVQRFAAQPEEVILGKDIRLSFPEFIGLEDILISILQGEQELIELKGIGKYSEDNCELYSDIYIISESEKNRLIIIFEDVTERVVLEQRLSEKFQEEKLLSDVFSNFSTSKKSMDNVIVSMADALVVTTESGEIKEVNRAAIELFGYSEEELISRQISMIIDDNKLLQKSLQQRPFLKEKFQNLEVICRTKTREKRLISFSCSIIHKTIDSLEEIIYVGRDITARKRRQQRIRTQYVIARILSESQSIKQAIPQILQAICESLGWDLGELWSSSQYITTSLAPQSINPVLRCVEMWSSRTVAVREFKAITWQTTYAPGVGLPSRIWATRSPVWIQDIVNDSDLRQLPEAKRPDWRSQTAAESGLHTALGFPILNNNKILGIMIFFSRDVQAKDADILHLLVSIGSQIAHFIQQKRASKLLLKSEERNHLIQADARIHFSHSYLAGKAEGRGQKAEGIYPFS